MAIAGVALTATLVFLQLGLYSSMGISATRLLEILDFDAVLISPSYFYFNDPGELDRSRLAAAAAVDGVRAVVPVSVRFAAWRKPSTGRRYTILTLGVDPTDSPFALAEITSRLPLLNRRRAALTDLQIGRSFRELAPGGEVEVGGRRIDVVDGFHAGPGFAAKAVVLVSRATFADLFGARWDHTVSLGLLRLAPGAELADVLARLDEALPADTQAWSRQKVLAHDRHYYLSIKPIGIMFISGVVIALLVATVVLYQTVSSDIRNHLGEYATLEAMGYAPLRLRVLVVEQGALVALLGFVPAALAAWVLYGKIDQILRLPMPMTWERIAQVLALCLGASLLTSLLAIRRLESADPADLF